MYAIVYWVNDMYVFPYLNTDNGLWLFESLDEADATAEKIENGTAILSNYDKDKGDEIEARVISIEGVK